VIHFIVSSKLNLTGSFGSSHA